MPSPRAQSLAAEGLGTAFLLAAVVGICPADVPGFIGARVLGGTAGARLVHWLAPDNR